MAALGGKHFLLLLSLSRALASNGAPGPSKPGHFCTKAQPQPVYKINDAEWCETFCVPLAYIKTIEQFGDVNNGTCTKHGYSVFDHSEQVSLFGLNLTVDMYKKKALTGTGRIKVFVLAGQSNMEGQAEVNATWPNGTLKNGTLLYQTRDPRTAAEFAPTINNKTGKWTVRDDVWVWFNERGKSDDGTWGPLTVGFGVGGSPEHIGPEYGFGFKMGDALDEQVLIIKTAWGGKTLSGDFRPPSSCNKTNNKTVGYYYKQMLQDVHGVLAPENLTKYFPGAKSMAGYDIVGFGWFQGWNDGCSSGPVEEYEWNMVNLIKDLRTEFKNPTLAVSIPVSGFAGWTQKNTRRLGIIDAQFGAANMTRHPELGGHVVAEETRSFWRGMEYSPVPNQGYHWGHNAESYWLIGQAMGTGMLEAMKPKQEPQVDQLETFLV